MNKLLGSHQSFLVAALIIALVANNTNCVEDDFCDPDPIRGGCPSSCEWAGWGSFFGKSIGFFFLLEIGSYLGLQQLKDTGYLKKFMREDLSFRWKTEQVLKEIEIENRDGNKRIDKLIKDL